MMKKQKLFLVLILLFTAIFCSGEVLYYNNFDDCVLGKIVENYTNEWSYYSSYTGNENVYAKVDSNGYGGKGHSLCFCVAEKGHYSDFGAIVKIQNTENRSVTHNIKVSFLVKITDYNYIYFGKKDDFSLHFEVTPDAESFCIASLSDSFRFDNYCPVETWQPVSYTINANPKNPKILEVQFGDAIYKNLDIPIEYWQGGDDYSNFGFYFDTYYDFSMYIDELKVELIERNVPDVKLKVTGNERLALDKDALALKLFNEGKKTAEIEITCDQSFVSLNGEKFLKTNLAAGDIMELDVAVDRSSMSNDYYLAKINIRSQSEILTKRIFIPSGSKKEGYTFYKSYFEQFETGKNITEVDSAWGVYFDKYEESEAIAKIVEFNGENVFMLSGDPDWWYDYAYVACNTLTGLSGDHNYRISYKIYVPKGYDTKRYLLGLSVGSYRDILIVDHDQDGRGLKQEYMGNICPYDEWIDLSYTFNLQPENSCLLSLSFGNITSNLNMKIDWPGTTNDYFNYARFNFPGDGGITCPPVYLKDIVVKSVPKPDTGPVLEVKEGSRLLLDDENASLTVFNAGTKDLSFSAEVTSGKKWISISGADMGSGILRGIVPKGGSKKYVLNIDRAKLGNAYGLGQITVTGAGCSKVVTYFVQSSDETGITLYSGDFDNYQTGKLCDIDPAFNGPKETVLVVPDQEKGGSCLEIGRTGSTLYYNYLDLYCDAPEGVSSNYVYAVSMKIKCPDGYGWIDLEDDSFSTIIGRYNISHSSGNVKLYPQDCDNNPFSDVSLSADKWFNFGFIVDAKPQNKRLLSLTFGDKTILCNESISSEDTSDDLRYLYFKFQKDNVYYLDDIKVELIPSDLIPGMGGVMRVYTEKNPVPYSDYDLDIDLINDGAGKFNYTAEVIKGDDWLSLNSYKGSVVDKATIKALIDRIKLGYEPKFHRGKIKFSSSSGQSEIVDIYVQAGNSNEGYVLYSSFLDDLLPSKITGETVSRELSEQDPFWDRRNEANQAAVIFDPIDPTHKCIKMIETGKNDGYRLNLTMPKDVSKNYDVVINMKMLIPETFAQSSEENSPPYFSVTQDDDHHIAEVALSLNGNGKNLNVVPDFPDLKNDNWWEEHSAASEAIKCGEWFTYYTRFNCKSIDRKYKRFYAFTFGENEHHLEGNDQIMDYHNGIKTAALSNEEMPDIEFRSTRDNADVLIKDVTIALVNKDIPEPAILGALAIMALALWLRKN